MAYTPPKTWTSEELTSVLLNEQLRDNLLHIAGSTGKGSDPSRTPCVRAYKSGTQSIANGTATTLTWADESYDTDAMHDNVTNNTRLTVQTAGKYRVALQVSFDANATGGRNCSILLNGGTGIGVQWSPTVGSGAAHSIQCAAEYDFAAGDYVEARCAQGSGGALDVLAGVGLSWFAMSRIG